MDHKKPLLAVAFLCAAGLTQAGEKEELLKLRNTTTNLIKQLVKQGILTDKMAEDMIKQAEADAGQQVAEAKAAAGKEAVPADEVRVTYVPDFVKDEIRQQVRSELREEVVGDVMQKAKKEQWGLPGALPEWVRRFKLSGDIRLREQSQFTANDNIPFSYFNWPAINLAGGINNAGPNAFLNTTQDINLLRERLRLGMDVNIAEGLNAGVRLATGNIRNPVSTNQTLGNYGTRWEFDVDRAYLKYDILDSNKFNWLTVAGGRMQNPWFSVSELVWDEDLSFEGVAGTVRHRFNSERSVYEVGVSTPTVFATAGAFPLQNSGLTSHQKWLFGGQVGLDWGFANQDALKAGVAYYDYTDIQAVINKNAVNTCDTNSAASNFSVPQFMQFGNSLTNICNQGTINNPGPPGGLVGLASDYNILNANLSYDVARFAPIHVKLSGDYAKNLGFNQQAILAYTGQNISNQTVAWQIRVDLGWPKINHFGSWNVFTGYRSIEANAVLDAFTDSDFHLGGTNAKGWMIGGNIGLVKNVWLTGRWLSADVISGRDYGLDRAIPYGVDVLQLDLNTRF